MEVATIKHDIMNKTLKDFYIFAGDEWAVQDIYIKQIAKAANATIKYIESIRDVYSNFKQKSFVKQSFVYVCRDDEELMSSEKLWQQIRGGLFGSNIYILRLGNVDKRTKFYKEFSERICVFDPLEPKILKKYIQAEIALSDKNCQQLMQVCENNYGRCLLEVDKIKQCMKSINADDMPNNIFEMLLFDGTITSPPKDAIFDFVDAVLRHQVSYAFELLKECYAVGEATLVMLSVLFNNAKNVLQVQTYKGSELSKITGLTNWEIKLAKEKLNYYSDEDLIYILKETQAVERQIKQGKIDEDFAMDYLLTRIL